MWRLSVLQNRWLILALVVGAFLVLMTVLAYWTLWRRRPATEGGAAADGRAAVEDGPFEPPGQGPGLRDGAWGFMPLVLIVVYVASIVLGLAYTIVWSLNPPNW